MSHPNPSQDNAMRPAASHRSGMEPKGTPRSWEAPYQAVYLRARGFPRRVAALSTLSVSTRSSSSR
jgi:hypothetical protein